MLGDFSTIIKGQYELIYISIPLVILAYLFANKFTVAGMGEDFSVNLGMNYKAVVNVGLVIVALISSVVILTVGTIPFLGLVVPNIVTLYIGDNLKKVWHIQPFSVRCSSCSAIFWAGSLSIHMKYQSVSR